MSELNTCPDCQHYREKLRSIRWLMRGAASQLDKQNDTEMINKLKTAVFEIEALLIKTDKTTKPPI